MNCCGVQIIQMDFLFFGSPKSKSQSLLMPMSHSRLISIQGHSHCCTDSTKYRASKLEVIYVALINQLMSLKRHCPHLCRLSIQTWVGWGYTKTNCASSVNDNYSNGTNKLIKIGLCATTTPSTIFYFNATVKANRTRIAESVSFQSSLSVSHIR